MVRGRTTGCAAPRRARLPRRARSPQLTPGVTDAGTHRRCGHCKALAPVYERLARTLKAEGSAVTVAKMDGTGNREAMERLGANSYPSIYFVRNGNQFHKYALARDEPSLLMYAKEGALALPDSEWTTLPPAPTIVDKVLETWTDKKNALACVFSAGVTVGGVITYVLML